MIFQKLHKNLTRWYIVNKRNLPWRGTKNPYNIWLSEIILQQTRVNQGLPYYLDFLKKFPNLESLAKSSETEVLRQWQGLGYYSRARNIHKCAKLIISNHKGRFPESFDELLALPGVGPYTAAAIASFAFNKPEAAIDGNAIRVYTRLLGIKDDTSKAATIKKLKFQADELIDKKDPGSFNQAIMELGATVCTPRNPKCNTCPFASFCAANHEGNQEKLPVKAGKTKIRSRYFNYFLIRRGEMVALAKRSSNDIWKGLYDFYLLESTHLFDPESISDPFLQGIMGAPNEFDVISEDKKHILSHQVIYARFFEIILRNGIVYEPDGHEIADLNFYSKKEILDLPKPVLVTNFLDRYFKEKEQNKGFNERS